MSCGGEAYPFPSEKSREISELQAKNASWPRSGKPGPECRRPSPKTYKTNDDRGMLSLGRTASGLRLVEIEGRMERSHR